MRWDLARDPGFLPGPDHESIASAAYEQPNTLPQLRHL